MANEEHVRKMNEGVDAWNEWRKENPHVLPDLSKADLGGANLNGAKLCREELGGADFTRAFISDTTFANVDLSGAKGLRAVDHLGPSTVGVDTLYSSAGKIPEEFLRGCGVPDALIEFLPSLIQGAEPIQFYSCFISYSDKDKEFAKRLHSRMQQEKLRVWFAPEDMKVGAEIRPTIEDQIRLRDKLLVVLSEQSLQSVWVKNEVEAAFEEERRRGETVLFPVRVDGVVMDTNQAWAATIRRTRHIGDFSSWKDHDEFETAFKRLLRDLKKEEEACETGGE